MAPEATSWKGGKSEPNNNTRLFGKGKKGKEKLDDHKHCGRKLKGFIWSSFSNLVIMGKIKKASNVRGKVEVAKKRQHADAKDKQIPKVKDNKAIRKPAGKDKDVLLLGGDGCKNNASSTASTAFKMKKKDKMKVKKQHLLLKLKEDADVTREAKEKKKRQARPVVGDMKPMAKSLEFIDQLLQETEEEEAKARKEKKKMAVAKGRSTKKEKKRKQEFMRDIAIMAQVKKHPQFARNPFETISTHIENSMILEQTKRDEEGDDEA